MPTPPSSQWVESLGGPLVVVPVAELPAWGGAPASGDPVAGDYGRACAVDDLAGVIPVGAASAIVLGDDPATTCWVPEQHAFLRWVAAESDAEFLSGAATVLDDPATAWADHGTWETPGPAVLMDAAATVHDLGEIGVPDIAGTAPRSMAVPVTAGRWRVQACWAEPDDRTTVMIVRLLPA